MSPYDTCHMLHVNINEPLMITCTLINIICLQWQNIVAIVTIPDAFEFVACTVIVALSVSKTIVANGLIYLALTQVIFEDSRKYI